MTRKSETFLAIMAAVTTLCASILGADEGEWEAPDYLKPERAIMREVTSADRRLLAEIMGMKAQDLKVSQAGYTFTGKTVAFPRASSVLPDDGYGPYGPDRAADGSSKGAWAEGVKGPGLGSWLAVRREWQGDLVSISPGFSGKAWIKNNRPKDVRIMVFGIVTDKAADGGGMVFGAEMIEIALRLPDEDRWMSLRQPGSLPEADGYLAVLVIDSVYKGTTYDDTCVSAFGLDVGQ